MGNKVGNLPATRRSRRLRQVLSWGAVGADNIRAFVAALTDNGCAVLFGRTMDGGALTVHCFCGENKPKEYISTYADVVPVFATLIEEMVDGEIADALYPPTEKLVGAA
jgi:hypothetical protein